MEIYLIRHGETDWNKERRLQGHSDIPLNEFGRELAVETAKSLAGLPFDRAAGEELMEAAGRDYMSGITFSGGDPLYPSNREEIGRLCQALKGRFPDKTIWLYTGYLWEEPAVQQLPWLPLVDVLVDGPFVEALKDNRLHWCGSSNQRIIDVPKSLAAGSAVLWKG